VKITTEGTPLNPAASRGSIIKPMNNNKPDFMWILALVVALGVASTQLMGDESPPRMAAQQAGIIAR
jgi:hypothetical protein